MACRYILFIFGLFTLSQRLKKKKKNYATDPQSMMVTLWRTPFLKM